MYQPTSSPFSWQNELQDWTKKAGLQQYLGTGLQDSTIGKSGLYDLATQAGQQFRQKQLAGAEQAIGPAPVAGIDPQQAVQAGLAEKAAAYQQREGARTGGYEQAMANQQSTTDWINQMMGATSQLLNKNQQEWHDYRQGLLTAGAQNAAGKNAMSGAYIGAGGAAAGATLGIAAAVII
jgi:hypothetical protein